ncbi:MAG: restriction endonuclease [Lachnospiraceae bacterium]|nr:restriction endonuclease [Lachnospiraceae bacterium]
MQYAPIAWKKFITQGRNGIVALKAPKILKVPTKYEQLQSDDEGLKCVQMIREHYKDDPYGFETCAIDIVSKMDGNFIDFTRTRSCRDGGRDAIGYYLISTGGKTNRPLKVDCALEAKCYSENSGVGITQMSRLISRIRYRQFGIMVTTSYVESQAYSEVIEDDHPILIVTAADIAGILRTNQIDPSNIDQWLRSVDGTSSRLRAYQRHMQKMDLGKNR